MAINNFDPTKYGATLIEPELSLEGFDPTKYGATPTVEEFEVIPEKKTIPGFFENVLEDSKEIITSMYDALRHPAQTVTNLSKLLLGTVQKVIPGKQKHEEIVDALGRLYKKKYFTSIQDTRDALYNDPVEVLLDLSIVLSGGGALATKLGKVGKLDKLAEYSKIANKADRSAAIQEGIRAGEFGQTARAGLKVQKLGETISPITIPSRAVSKTMTLVEKQIRNFVVAAEETTGLPIQKVIFEIAKQSKEKPPGFVSKVITRAEGSGVSFTINDLLIGTLSYAVVGPFGAAGTLLLKKYIPIISQVTLEAALKNTRLKMVGLDAEMWLNILNQTLKKVGVSTTDKVLIQASIDLLNATKQIRDVAELESKADRGEELTLEEIEKIEGPILQRKEYTLEEVEEIERKKLYYETDTAKKLADSIMQVESGGKQVKGKSGEFGLFQWLKDTWNTVSKKITGKVLPQTIENEKEVATKKIQELLDKGWSPQQIALIWNTSLGGVEKPLIKKGVNKYGVSYDSEKYANKVMSIFNT